jgi:dethiobiotin synthetase
LIPERIFVTGSGTGVGKTLISAVLTAGLDAKYWKPIQSGFNNLPHFLTDAFWVQKHLELAEQRIIPETYAFRAPVSPHQAAASAGQKIDTGKILRQFGELDPTTSLVVEGAGGLMVPLNDEELMIDLIMEMALPVLVVSSTSLGTINHTLLTIEALQARDISIAGIVLNGAPNPSSKSAIERFSSVKVIAEVPELKVVNSKTLKEAFVQCFAGVRELAAV